MPQLPRRAIKPKAVVIGVYPSAFHVSWQAPAYLRETERRGRVSALAVDVEPTVFWDGKEPDASRLLSKWLQDVGFEEGDAPGQHGHVSRRLPSANGSSGRKVIHHYLQPLGLSEQDVTFTDLYPVFMIKGNQFRAIRTEYDPIAEQLGFRRTTLPIRIPAKTMPTRAIRDFGDRLRQELEDSKAEQVITLGEETWRAVVELFGRDAETPLTSFQEAYDDYGKPGTIRLKGRTIRWWALVHPGLIRGRVAGDPGTEDKRSVTGWSRRHFSWASNVGRQV